jgi:hypothetical protein
MGELNGQRSMARRPCLSRLQRSVNSPQLSRKVIIGRLVAWMAKCKSVQEWRPACMLKLNWSFDCCSGCYLIRLILLLLLCSSANSRALVEPVCTATCNRPILFLFFARRFAPLPIRIWAHLPAISGFELKFENTMCKAVLPCSFGTLTSSSTDSSGVFN